MATYNWTYKSGFIYVPIKGSSVTLATSDDYTKPSNGAYVALSGNDVLGNGSRVKPFRTISKASSISANKIIVISSGVYREKPTLSSGQILLGDGDVVINGTGFSKAWEGSFFGARNIVFKNANRLGDFNDPGSVQYCSFMDFLAVGDLNATAFKFCKFIRLGSLSNEPFYTPRSIGADLFSNCTFVDCLLITFLGSVVRYNMWNNIFLRCNIIVQNEACLNTFSLYYQCNFRFGSPTTFPTGTYPTTPTGYTLVTSIATLRSLHVATFPLASMSNFIGCVVDEPKFNNLAIGDYSLAFDSPAKNLSYYGTYVGAQSISYPIKASATETSGDFDFSTTVNVIVANNSITMTNPALTSIIETNCKANLIQRAFSKVSVQGFDADRNGQYIDSIKDLSAATISAGTNLVANTPYIVEVSSITYNGTAILAGERFTTTAVLSFTSAGGGVCREITEAPQRHTIEARFSDGGATKNVGDALTIGYWYYVSGTITYNGVDYTNRTFKAVDTNSFTGAGILMEALTTQAYQHYEIGIPFTSNNVGDARTGEIVRGNGDPAYERGATKEFPINARFVQIKFTIQPNNLKP